jgi:ribosomal protein L25 (general stress protein Ctc)
MLEKTTEVTIEATTRDGRGKTYTRKLRKSGKIPAVLNGGGKSTVIELDPKLLPRAWKSETKQFNLVLAGSTHRVKITELHIDPVKRLALHVDLAPVG